jgi:predicted Rossmann fold nucleotide-binding protein DprA/Smf involved in DNA uptake
MPVGPTRSQAKEGTGRASPILATLRHDPATRDELCTRLGWSAQRVASELLPLELDGRVVEDRDGRLRVILPRS